MGMSGIEPGSATYKANSLTTLLLLGAPDIYFSGNLHDIS